MDLQKVKIDSNLPWIIIWSIQFEHEIWVLKFLSNLIRAFLNGRMDLVEAEGMADLINAETEMQRKQALAQMEGHLSSVYKHWRQSVIKCLANVEAYIDFSEDQNVDENALDDGKYNFIIRKNKKPAHAHTHTFMLTFPRHY